MSKNIFTATANFDNLIMTSTVTQDGNYWKWYVQDTARTVQNNDMKTKRIQIDKKTNEGSQKT